MALVANHQVKFAVSIEIDDAQGLSILSTGCILNCCLESSVTVAQQHANRARGAVRRVITAIGHKKIGMAVAVHIFDNYRTGIHTA